MTVDGSTFYPGNDTACFAVLGQRLRTLDLYNECFLLKPTQSSSRYILRTLVLEMYTVHYNFGRRPYM